MAQRDLNKVILIGNIGRDPDLRQTENGSAISTFSLATNTTWVNRDGVRNERTEWHNIVAWNRLAEICNQIIRKGDQIYVEGRLRTRTWIDENGERRRKTEIIAEQMIKLNRKFAENVNKVQVPEGKSVRPIAREKLNIYPVPLKNVSSE